MLTALTACSSTNSDNDPATEIVTDAFHERPQANQLHVSSTRCGNVPGTHKVFFDGTADTIELTHTARSREGFAVGAVESLVKLDAALKSAVSQGFCAWKDIKVIG